ncbi:MAG: ATP-binding protein [Chloroflexia bacterium]
MALLAFLAVTKQRHTRDKLAALFWPEYDQTHARGALRRTLSALNKALAGDQLSTEGETIGLNPGSVLWLDVDAFHGKLAERGTHGHPPAEVCPRCLAPLKEAVELYRDDFMSGFTLRDSPDFDEWQFFQAEGLRRELASALDQLVRCYVALNDFGPAIQHARRRLALDRLHEPAHRELMLLYARSGQRAAAIQQYRACVQVLDQELGVPPLEETTLLYNAIKENRIASSKGAEPAAGRIEPDVLSNAGYAAAPFVGRATERAALLSAYNGIRDKGSLVALVGEAGIGKTRLAEELLANAHATGATTVVARCYEGEAALAYGPVIACLRQLLGKAQGERRLESIPAEWLVEVSRLAPEIISQRPDLPSVPSLDSPGAQSRFLEGIRQVLPAACSGERPGILFFDDLQWADSATLDLLTYLARRLGDWPVCLVLAWRSDQASSGARLQPMVAEAQRLGLATLLSVPRLSWTEVDELVSLTIGPHGASPAYPIADHLYTETEGLPFFLVEYLAALTSGSLAASGDWSLPGGVRDLLSSRLAAVSGTGKQLLNTASVIGRSFDFETLREASGRSEEEAVSGLEELMAHGLVVEVSGGEGEQELAYDFSHEKLRNLVYEETSLARRRLLHRRVAEALASRRPGSRAPSAPPGVVAQHYRLAGHEAEAAEYFKLAGEQARALYANADALSHFRMSLALGHPDATGLHEAIGDMQTLLGEYGAALSSYETAASLLGRESSTARTLAALEWKLGGVHQRRGEGDLAERHYEAALQAIGDAGPPGVLSRIYADWSLTAHHRGDRDSPGVLAQRALELAEAGQDRHALAQAHNILGILASSSGDLAGARYHLEASLALAEALNDSSLRAAALNNLALALGAAGETDRGLALAEAALQLCVLQGDRHREAALHNNLADLLHSSGRMPEAIAHLKQAVAIYAEIGVEAGDVHPAIWKLAEW